MNSSQDQDSDAKLIDETLETKSTEPAPQVNPPEPTKTGHAKRNIVPLLLFFLTLALIFSSVGGTGFWLWTQFNHELTAQRQEINALRQTLADKASRQALAGLSHQSQEIAAQQQNQAHQLQSLVQTIRQSQAIILRDQRGWAVAEVEYLMRIARYRLDLLHDSRGAESALLLADQELAHLGDMSFLPVRKVLNEEIQSLRDFHTPDKIGILIQLNQIMSKIVLPTPFGGTPFTKTNNTPTAASTPSKTSGLRGLLEAVWQSISEHISIRHYPQPINDLAEITTQAQTTQAIYLDLQNARTAVLTGNKTTYHQSIKDVLNALKSASGNPALNKGLEQTLNKLDAIDIAPTPPVIGNALTLLQKMNAQQPASPEKGKKP